MAYRVTIRESALKEIGRLPRQISQRVLSKVTALGANPRPHGCLKMEGGGNLWRVRVGDYRVIYVIDDSREIVDVRIVAHRREAYRV